MTTGWEDTTIIASVSRGDLIGLSIFLKVTQLISDRTMVEPQGTDHKCAALPDRHYSFIHSFMEEVAESAMYTKGLPVANITPGDLHMGTH